MTHIMKLLTISLDKMAFQKQELLKANKALTRALEEEQGRVLKLMIIISEESAEKLVLKQKLEEANSKLSKVEYASTKTRALPKLVTGSV